MARRKYGNFGYNFFRILYRLSWSGLRITCNPFNPDRVGNHYKVDRRENHLRKLCSTPSRCI